MFTKELYMLCMPCTLTSASVSVSQQCHAGLRAASRVNGVWHAYTMLGHMEQSYMLLLLGPLLVYCWHSAASVFTSQCCPTHCLSLQVTCMLQCEQDHASSRSILNAIIQAAAGILQCLQVCKRHGCDAQPESACCVYDGPPASRYGWSSNGHDTSEVSNAAAA